MGSDVGRENWERVEWEMLCGGRAVGGARVCMHQCAVLLVFSLFLVHRGGRAGSVCAAAGRMQRAEGIIAETFRTAQIGCVCV